MGTVLALKFLLVPMLILLVTLAGKKWGPAVAGWLSAFPIVAGPILLVLCLEHGVEFCVTAAGGTLTAVLAMLCFSLSYAWVSAKFSVFGTLGIAITAYGLSVMLLQRLVLSINGTFGLVIAALLIAPNLFPRVVVPEQNLQAPSHLHWRMLAGLTLVLLVSHFANAMGPKLSGFLAMFPVMGTVLASFSHRFNGREFAVALLSGTVFGFFAFAVFCFILAKLLPIYSMTSAFLCALILALVTQITTKKLTQIMPPSALSSRSV